MNISGIANILIVVALVVWIVYRQFTWQLVNPSRLWRMPVIITIIGIAMLASTKSLTAVQPLAVAILVGEITLSLALGAAMGTMARFRSRPQRESDVDVRKGQTFNPAVSVIESRTGGIGASLWVLLIAIRVGTEVAVNTFYPSALLASTGTILIVVAANRFARAFVVQTRMDRQGLLTAA